MNLWRKVLPVRLAPVLRPAAPVPSRPWLHVLLFLLTLISMTAAGAMLRGVNPLARLSSLVHLVEGIPFAAALLAILTVHEFGHYFAARHWGVKATLPYFLPLPYVSFLGTLGAVIKIRSAIPHRPALLDIGAAGPVAGFVLSVLACVVGLSQSQVVTPEYFYPNAPIYLGSPLLFTALTELILPSVDAGQQILLSPVAFAGWVGLFITALNLCPVGQLDGGHIAYALFGSVHRDISRAFFLILLVMGLYGILSMVLGWPHGWPGWLALTVLLALLGRDHPAPLYAYLPLGRTRRFLGYLSILIFVLCISPVPFTYTGP
jgi:membrane-associated protease RseP (regulator of RpoE activity)